MDLGAEGPGFKSQPDIKAMLRRKNRLMRAGRVEEAGALAERIGKAVTRRSKKRLCRIDRQHGAKAMWEALRQMTGRRQNVRVVDGVSADSHNEHYAQISTDDQYVAPLCKYTVREEAVDIRMARFPVA